MGLLVLLPGPTKGALKTCAEVVGWRLAGGSASLALLPFGGDASLGSAGLTPFDDGVSCRQPLPARLAFLTSCSSGRPVRRVLLTGLGGRRRQGNGGRR